MFSQSEIKKSMLLLSGLFVSGVAGAAIEEGSSAPSYRMGGVLAYPGLGVVLKNDSNIHRASVATSSFVTVISPSVLLQTQQDANSFSFAYTADIGRYGNSSADNYVDQKFLGQAVLGLSTRSTLKMLPEYLIGHDDRGSTFGVATTEPNKWQSSGINGSFTYGAENAGGNLVVDLGFSDRVYQNNRTLTTAYDRSLNNAGGTFYLNVWPKTSALVSVKFSGISYKQATTALSSTEQRIMVGAKWDATSQTSGEVKIGQLQKKFDTTNATQSGASWEGEVHWSPVSFVNVDFTSSKQPSEATLNATTVVLVGNTGANASYSLNDRVTLNANFNVVKEDFVGNAGTVRSDSTNNFGIKADYKFRSWLIGSAEFTNSAKTSDAIGGDYKRNIFWVGLRSVQ